MDSPFELITEPSATHLDFTIDRGNTDLFSSSYANVNSRTGAPRALDNKTRGTCYIGTLCWGTSDHKEDFLKTYNWLKDCPHLADLIEPQVDPYTMPGCYYFYYITRPAKLTLFDIRTSTGSKSNDWGIYKEHVNAAIIASTRALVELSS